MGAARSALTSSPQILPSSKLTTVHSIVGARLSLAKAMLEDLRYALRLLLKSPGFTAAAVLSLALGIGANSAIFSLIDAVMLKTLPVSAPEQLVILGPGDDRGVSVSSNPMTSKFSYPRYLDLRDGNSTVASLTAIVSSDYNVYLKQDAGPRRTASVRMVSGNYFSTLGVGALLGRVLGPEDDENPGGHRVVVLSHRSWRTRYASAPDIVGRELLLNGMSYSVIGVTPEWFEGERRGDDAELWVPHAMQAQIMRNQPWFDQRRRSYLNLMGRLAPGATLAQAEAELATLWQRIIVNEEGAEITAQRRQRLAEIQLTLRSGARGYDSLSGFRNPLTLLMAVVAMVLLIACANVANLLLGRAKARQKEMGVRLALGAGRTRVLRQLLTESLILAGLGAGLGLVVASWGRSMLVSMIATNPSGLAVSLSTDWRVLGFTAAVAVATAIGFGLLPALRASRPDLVSSLKVNSRGVVEGGRFGSQRALVVVQAAVSLILLVAAGLFLQSLGALLNAEMGFRAESLFSVRIDPKGGGYREEETPLLYQRILDTVGAVPGVVESTISIDPPITGSRYMSSIDIEGYEFSEREDNDAGLFWVMPGYFRVAGTPIVKGRAFDDRDREGSEPVAIVNQTIADRFFSNREVLGGRVQIGSDWFEIVGVSRNAKHYGLDDPARPFIYLSAVQRPKFLRSVLVRAQGDPEAVLGATRLAIERSEPALPVRDGRTIEQLIYDNVRMDRALANLTGVFALLALTLAALGLYGVMSYAVNRRVNEIGVRMAIGAQRRDVLWLVLGEALLLVAIGAAMGWVGSFAGGGLIAGLLHEVSTLDPTVLAGATFALLAVGALAGLAPALRAAGLDPLVALRDE